MNIPQLKSRQGGFTMIELIVVMVILGILAAFAIPRFANLTGEARIAAINGTKAGFSSAVTIIRSKWLASGGNGATVTLEDGTAVAVTNGYPAATVAGICSAVQFDTSSVECVVGTDGVGNIDVRLVNRPLCKFTYTPTGTPVTGVAPLVVAEAACQ